ncbi:hypothetical protein [Microbacterium sp. Root280D1]|uniref:hypothetical protein n=1 Tax=Microbacterium sp. Root280D1 TaxID=1736510 RepID=UPI0006F2CA6D|nr:hypothetical protein [Microbacterium sp. Root280D1]KRD51970.1 hypothetical protein ASE34_08620 [Microbacterium sp. Root280D1]
MDENEIRDELQSLADEASTYVDRRDAAVARAREAHMKWEEIAGILGMTPHGLRKALNKRSEES